MLVACSRMYDVNAAAQEAWWTLFSIIADKSGVELRPLSHNGSLEELWRRNDLGCTFMCGFPWVATGRQHPAIAAPVPLDARSEGRPHYVSDYVAVDASPIGSMAQASGCTIGWSVQHSQSGYQAPRHHLMDLERDRGRPLFARSVGPLHTPNGCLEALDQGVADVVPIDSLYFRVGQLTDPDRFARYRSIGHTPPRPMPLFVASPNIPTSKVRALGQAVCALHNEKAAADTLALLGIKRFVLVDPESYDIIREEAAECDASGVGAPI
ncbi:MAG: PhnD/SsuA/transferrin family substrate-binding protein [Spiribacter salinus]|uniref:PhnD/SsuA/transferrin family substrate-binding protein n=1 Tax=Spiribacter salinus TaxID=1335746 RepID=A0A540VR72_9GAMM|nr:MAG: PhnD/SsuA/transferrin family substrate-binding protein [Spiribacter salinus]